jgi:hypothetical protein
MTLELVVIDRNAHNMIEPAIVQIELAGSEQDVAVVFTTQTYG